MTALLHQLNRHMDRMDYCNRKIAMCNEQIRSSLSTQKERMDFTRWKGIVEGLKEKEHLTFLKRIE